MKYSKIAAGLLCTALAAGLAGLFYSASFEKKTSDPSYVRTSIEALTADYRGVGREGEKAQLKRLAKNLKSYGYEVEFDQFTGTTVLRDEFKSQNLIARKKADKNPHTADILILSSHIDSIASTTGAIDNASGTAVLETIAKNVSELPTDTELWFLIFSGEEEGLLGSSHFASELPKEVKSRILGDLQLDMLGHYLADGYTVSTPNGLPNVLSDMLIESAEAVTENPITLTQEKASDHVSFAAAQIPAVLFHQAGDGYENHTILDDLSQVDFDFLETGVTIAEDTVRKIMSEDTGKLAPSYKKKEKRRQFAGILNPDAEVPDMDLSAHGMQNAFGTGLELISETKEEVLGTIADYKCDIYWFGMEEPLETTLSFMQDAFQYGKIFFEKADLSARELIPMISALYGEPEITVLGEGQTSYIWSYLPGRISFDMLVSEEEGSELTFYPYHIGNEELTSIPIAKDGTPAAKLDDATRKLWDDILAKVIRPQDLADFISKIQIYTDGQHFSLAFTTPASPEEPKVSLWVDYNDMFYKDGTYRHFYKSVATVIHEYGHILSQNRTQLDLKAAENSIDLAPALEDSYIAAFMKEFYPNQDVDDHTIEGHYYFGHPQDYVSQYACDKTREDFAESFMCFVLSDKQDPADTIARKKINFFYDYPEFIEIRQWIRGNFDWIR